MKISILDCTLRDGGYVNNFRFGISRIKTVKENLCEANIEIIECGFLKSGCNDPGTTLYGCVSQIKLPLVRNGHMFVAMIAYGEIRADEIIPHQPEYIDGIRLTFHNSEWEDTKCLAENLMRKGYKVFIQPIGTTVYTDEDLLTLIKDVNKINPFAFYVVDTLGSMYKNDLLRKFFLVEYNLKNSICLGFHSHNNMQLSFANSMMLLELHTERHIIIDSSVFGMGRGAGNLNTELITHYVNCNIDKRYNLVPLLELIDDVILPIYKYDTWGFSEPYYLSAIMGVHPNYAAYLLDKQSIGMTKIFEILNKLQDDGNHLFKKQKVEELYYNEMSNNVEDSKSIKKLASMVYGKEVLVIAPGSSIKKHSMAIKEYIASYSPFVISLNFIPYDILPNLVFISNRKRFKQIGKTNLTIAVTSNININDLSGVYVINYDSLLQGDSDSSGIMALRFIIRLGVKRVKLAGYDGFTSGDNHYDESLDSYLSAETVIKLNNSMSGHLREISKSITIDFLTPSIYEEQSGDI